MDLSPTVLLGLQVAGSIPDKPFSILVDHAVGTVIGNGDLTSLHGSFVVSSLHAVAHARTCIDTPTTMVHASRRNGGD